MSSDELIEEMELLSAMFPNECYLTDENRLIFGPVDGLELELDLPRHFPVGGANNTPRLVSVTGASVAGVESLLSRIFGDGTTATGSGGLDDDDDDDGDDDGERGSLFEFIQSARDLAATEQSQPQPQLPPPATKGKTTQNDNNNEQNVPKEESPFDQEEAALLRTHLPTSLETAGFTRYGDYCFVHQQCSCEVEIAPNNGVQQSIILATAEGIDGEDLAQFVAMELSVRRYAEFGTQLLEGVRMMRHMASEAAEADDTVQEDGVGSGHPAVGTQEDYDERCRDRLPSPEEIYAHPRWKANDSRHSPVHINPERRLHIYTWGDALLKKPSLKKRGSQFDINAKPLNGRGGGADTRRNALQDGRIRLNVASSLGEERGRNMLVQTLWKIEQEDLSCISVFCSKGRHRSVSLALLLKMVYYPQATIEHLTIK